MVRSGDRLKGTHRNCLGKEYNWVGRACGARTQIAVAYPVPTHTNRVSVASVCDQGLWGIRIDTTYGNQVWLNTVHQDY